MAEKAEKLNSDIYKEDFELLNQVIEAQNLSSRKEGLHTIFNRYRGISHSTMELAPSIDLNTLLPCTHREIVPPQESDKNRIEYWCVFRRSCTPIQAKEIKHLQFCRSCQSQQYQLPASHSAETEADKPEITKITEQPEQKPLLTFPTQRNWDFKFARVVNADGSKMCPFSEERKHPQHCYLCKKSEPKKHEQCVQLRAVIALNTQP